MSKKFLGPLPRIPTWLTHFHRVFLPNFLCALRAHMPDIIARCVLGQKTCAQNMSTKSGCAVTMMIIILTYSGLTNAQNDHNNQRIDRAPYDLAIERAKRFIDQTNLSVGPLFLKQKLSPETFDETTIPSTDAFSRLFGEKFKIKNLRLIRMINSNIELQFIPKLKPINNYFYVLPTQYKQTLQDPWDDILIKALYCDTTGFDELDFDILSTLSDQHGGYYDTHQLLGLLILQSNTCFNKDKITQAKNTLVDNIVYALDHDTTFSDLYAERVVCLFWAGARNRIKPEWIQIIKNAQRPDGGWADIGQRISLAHPTGLAALSIKYFLSPTTAIFIQKYP